MLKINEDYKISLGAILDANAKKDIDKQLEAIKDLSIIVSKAKLSDDAVKDIKNQLTASGIDLNLVFSNKNQIVEQARQIGQDVNKIISQSAKNSSGALDAVQQKSSTSTKNAVKQQSKEIAALINQINQLHGAANNQNALKSIKDVSHIQSLSSAYNDVIAGIERMSAASNDTFNTERNNVKILIDNYKSLVSEFRNAEVSVSKKSGKIQNDYNGNDYTMRYNSTVKKTNQWVNASGDSIINTQKLTESLNALGNAYTKITSEGGNTLENQKALIAAEKEFNVELNNVRNEINKTDVNTAKSSSINTFHQQLQTFYDKNPAAHNKWGKEIQEMLDKTTKGAMVSNDELSKMTSRFTEIGNAARQSGKLGNTFFGSIKDMASKFTTWISASTIVMEGFQQVRKMITSVYEIDTAMTNLYKVTDETDYKYNKFLENANSNAKKLGRSISNIVEQTANWAKLGYNIDEASKLAQVSSIYANVGEVDDKTAVSDLVTAMKAFNIEADDTINIVDQLNKLGNEFATSAKDLGEGLRNSASAMALGGNSIEKTLALLTGGSEITQQASEMGNALKIGQMRVRGIFSCLHIRKVYMQCYA